MYTEVYNIKIICPNCQRRDEVIHVGGAGCEAHLYCPHCDLDFAIEIIGGKFMSRIFKAKL